MTNTSRTGRTLRNRTVAGTCMQEGVTDSRKERNRQRLLEENPTHAIGMSTVNEEIQLGQDDDLTLLERIEPSQRRPENTIDVLTASDTEDILMIQQDRRRARKRATPGAPPVNQPLAPPVAPPEPPPIAPPAVPPTVTANHPNGH
ncbi:cathelicidin-2-like [Papaver somniferum]|uniref:cathelicidin-2-like n=1 Tax=Papaver somniferum TaxID=3469 RepID=UPI000E6F6861|nr:cathelicidin-2-like [Papaver somniferum]